MSRGNPGRRFAATLLLVPYTMADVRAPEQGAATSDDIDKGMQPGTGYAMGRPRWRNLWGSTR